MRRENLLLGLVCICSIIGAYLISDILGREQERLSPPRDLISNLPLGGFQKFAADIYWMLFLQYAGAHPIDRSNVDEFDARINRIVDLDPNFLRIYTEGALMLAPVSQEKAIALLDRGIKNEFTRDHWRLPMLAGQLIMRNQWDLYYREEALDALDLDQVRLAETYYELAMDSPNRQATAVNSYIRVKAVLEAAENGKSREYNELLCWHEFWLDNRGAGADGIGIGMGEGDGHRRGRSVSQSAGTSPFIDDTEYGSQLDISQKIVSVMRKARAESPDDVELNALVDEIKADIFPGVRFNDITLEPIAPDRVAVIEEFLNDVQRQPYTLTLTAPTEMTLLGVAGRTNLGEAVVSLLIDGKPAPGFTRLTYDSLMSTQGHACFAVVPAGSTLDLSVDSADPHVDLAFQVWFYYSQSR